VKPSATGGHFVFRPSCRESRPITVSTMLAVLCVTDSAIAVLRLAMSVCPFVRLFVYTVSFESTDLWPWFLLLCGSMTVAGMRLKFKVIVQGQRSRSMCTLVRVMSMAASRLLATLGNAVRDDRQCSTSGRVKAVGRPSTFIHDSLSSFVLQTHSLSLSLLVWGTIIVGLASSIEFNQQLGYQWDGMVDKQPTRLRWIAVAFCARTDTTHSSKTVYRMKLYKI